MSIRPLIEQTFDKSRHSYTTSIIAGTVLLAGGYALADYSGTLPIGFVRTMPMVTKLKQYCIENPERTAAIFCAATGISYLSYKLGHIWRLQRILDEYLMTSNLSNHTDEDFTEDERLKASQFLIDDSLLAKGL